MLRPVFLAILFGTAAYGCKTSEPLSESYDATTGAPQTGIPMHYLGTQDLVSSKVNFEAGGSVDSFTITSQMSNIPGTGGMGSRTPLNCRTAQAWASNAVSTFSSQQKCRVEYVGTGRLSQDLNGVALHIIPLDSNEQGFDAAAFNPKTKPLTPGAVAKVSAGPVKSANTGLDSARLETAMAALRKKFNSTPGGVLIANGQDCLKNARAAAWTDLQAHYYCQMPYTIRYCYSTILAETKNPVQALQYCSDEGNKSDWQAKRETMFHAYGPGGADWAWLLKDQGDVFKYVMFSQLGKTDFNIEQQNELINAFYGAAKSRPRRANDPWPGWAAQQPRYDVIRGMQSGSAPQAPPPVMPGPQPQPQPPGPAPAQKLAPGTYGEVNNLEAIGCTARLNAVNKNTGGNLLELDLTGGSGCFVNGQQISAGVAGKIFCKSSLKNCIYQTTLVNLQKFEREAKVDEAAGKVMVFSKDGSTMFNWQRIGP
jgi:hypothetical protein